MKDDIFGHEVISAIELMKEQIPILERRANACDPDAIRYVRSTTLNNCRARVNGEIDLRTFENNREKISKIIENFIEKCAVSPRHRK